MFEGNIIAQEGLVAAEKLSGNTLKAEFHKGAVYAFHIAKATIAKQAIEVAEKTIDNSDMEQLLCNTCKEFNVCELVAQKLRAVECVEYIKA